MTKAHRLLSHGNSDQTRNTEEALGWLLTHGGMSPCSDCAQAKENQNHAPKESDHVKSEVNGTRFFTAISTIKGGKKGPSVAKKNWCILVEESTQTEFSSFYYKKINMAEPTCEQINCWKDSGMPVNYIICDNAGDNLTLEERCNSADW